MDFRIEAFRPAQKSEIVDLSLRAWEPVFAALRPAVPSYAYDAFYPLGWSVRQAQEVEEVLDQDGASIWVALDRTDRVIGWVGLLFHTSVQLGEVRIMAVEPSHHRQGIGKALLITAERIMREQGLKVALVIRGLTPAMHPQEKPTRQPDTDSGLRSST